MTNSQEESQAKSDKTKKKDSHLWRVGPENKAESLALKKLWDERRGPAQKMSQAEFGKRFNIGSQAIVSTFLSGSRQLSLKGAIGFAQGLKCQISDFSPRLAAAKATADGGMPPSTVASIFTFRGHARTERANDLIPVLIEGDGRLGFEQVIDPASTPKSLLKMGGHFCKFSTEETRCFGFVVEAGEECWPRYRPGEVAIIDLLEKAANFDDCLVVYENSDGIRHFKILRVIDAGPRGGYVFDRWDGKPFVNSPEHSPMKSVFRISARLGSKAVVWVEGEPE